MNDEIINKFTEDLSKSLDKALTDALDRATAEGHIQDESHVVGALFVLTSLAARVAVQIGIDRKRFSSAADTAYQKATAWKKGAGK